MLNNKQLDIIIKGVYETNYDRELKDEIADIFEREKVHLPYYEVHGTTSFSCYNCGKDFLPEGKFCPYCGQKFSYSNWERKTNLLGKNVVVKER